MSAQKTLLDSFLKRHPKMVRAEDLSIRPAGDCPACEDGAAAIRRRQQADGLKPAPAEEKAAPPAAPRKTLVYVGYPGRAEERAFVRRYADRHGYAMRVVPLTKYYFESFDQVKNADLIVCWSRWQWHAPQVARLARLRGIPIWFFEQGFLAQKRHFLVDPTGHCGTASLCDDLRWVTDRDRRGLEVVRRGLREFYNPKLGDYVLVPYQVHNDATVLFDSPYNNMGELMREVRSRYPRVKIVGRPHPGGGNRTPPEGMTNVEVRKGPADFLRDAAGAAAVVGCTSTCLIEAAVMGKPTVALGDCVLSAWDQARRDDALAGLLALNVPRDGDPTYALERTGFRA